jgi:GT2 family glycosyltransferase|tara:strand:- start:273 stop:1043 length:771 start_codon:yes stop_codon:yes gene_type:complete
MISVIIPTYKEPEALDLCLRSAVEGMKTNYEEIIVVVDGTYDTNKEVLDKYETVKYIVLDENYGTGHAINIGVSSATQPYVLIVNDDNVFPRDWDKKLVLYCNENWVVAPNHIEPYDSIFEQFHIKDLGRDPKTFDLEKFWDYEDSISEKETDVTGSTFPVLISKNAFLYLGGWDTNYPSQAGLVADWDFFLKAKLSGLRMMRSYRSHFYHFVSLAQKSTQQEEANRLTEIECHEYAKWKWGDYIKHDPKTNDKSV